MGVPVATPLSVGDWFAGSSGLVRAADHIAVFERALGEMLAVPFVRTLNSGRAALFVALQAMQRMSGRTEVVIPAFVCPSVGRAVVKAGLQPVLCDVAPRGFGLDISCLETLLNRQTLAVVIPHLYGYMSEVQPIMDLAYSVRAMVIEDAAQAFGARSHGRFAGAIADVGIFSFGMSKVLGAMGGGAVVTSNLELRAELESVTETLRPSGKLRDLKAVAKLAMVGALIRSHHLSPFSTVWEHSMRGKDDSEDFEVVAYSSSHAAVAKAVFARASEITRVRDRNAAYFSRQLSSLDGIMLPEEVPGCRPVYLRFPIVVENILAKRELIRRLRAKGINASEMYSRESYEGLRGFASRRTACPRTEYLVQRMLNLPTHPYMRERDMADTVSAFAGVLSDKRTTEVAIA